MLRRALSAETASTEALKKSLEKNVIVRHTEWSEQSFTLQDFHISSEAQKNSKIQMNYQHFVVSS